MTRSELTELWQKRMNDFEQSDLKENKCRGSESAGS